MDIDRELEEILDDPLLDISDKETELFDIPADMQKAIKRNKADYIAQHKLCEDFEHYKPLFKQVHQDLMSGKRSLVKITKTVNLQVGHYYVVDGQLLLLEAIGSTGNLRLCKAERYEANAYTFQRLRNRPLLGGGGLCASRRRICGHGRNRQLLRRRSGYCNRRVKQIENRSPPTSSAKGLDFLRGGATIYVSVKYKGNRDDSI